ncbi:DUF262 domain-containing protein [Nocardioides marmorisolisilvae]|uniref:DUF262 domain-containing protein n=1 Tax=Nocardioides marmorisolisilvae TaxID=1542737 RepID=A0A3N0DS73_9ACTN|nr:DUF262 domain-containing protein [Nocardioides marmorisolisilvae]RNL78485.1 DUF262 domain-containing protein [Nocardioides marmorisolisilvae]
MQVAELDLEKLLTSSTWEVPVFQRSYQWDDELLEQLWLDIGELYRSPRAAKHFMGILLTEGPRQHRSYPTLDSNDLIDGQQRLITLFVLFSAMRDHFGDAPRRADSYASLLLAQTSPVLQERLVAQRADREALQACIRGEMKDSIKGRFLASRVSDAYWYFRYQLQDGERTLTDSPAASLRLRRPRGRAAGSDVSVTFERHRRKGIDGAKLKRALLKKLNFVRISIQKGDEPPASVFESINGLRLDLSQFDHIRNALFVRLGTEAEPLFFSEWEPMEKRLESVASRFVGARRTKIGDLFLQSYLVSEGVRATQNDIFGSVTARLQRDEQGRTGIAAAKGFLADLLDALPLFDAAVAVPSPDLLASQPTPIASNQFVLPPKMARRVENIQVLSAGPPAPFVMLIMRLYANTSGPKLTGLQAARLLRLVETLLVRQTLAGINLSPLRGWFTGLTAKLAIDIRKAKPADTYSIIDQELRTRLNAPDFCPDDDTVIDAMRDDPDAFNGLGSDVTFLLLRGINDALVGSDATEMTRAQWQVEHVFPQSISSLERLKKSAWANEVDAWGLDLEARRRLIDSRHHLGNLTLHRLNQSLSTKSFALKKPTLQNESLTISSGGSVKNLSIVKRQKWRGNEIDQRSDALLSEVCKAWPKPKAPRKR